MKVSKCENFNKIFFKITVFILVQAVIFLDFAFALQIHLDDTNSKTSNSFLSPRILINASKFPADFGSMHQKIAGEQGLQVIPSIKSAPENFPGEDVLFGGNTREFKLLLAALLSRAGSQNTVRMILESSGPVMSNNDILEAIFSKTTIKNAAALLAAVNKYAQEEGVNDSIQAAVIIAQGLGKDYTGTAQNIALIKGPAQTGRIEQMTEITAPRSSILDEALFGGNTREFKLLLAALLSRAGSQNTVRMILESSGPVMSNNDILEAIFSKTTIKNAAALLAAVNKYAQEEGVNDSIQAAVIIAQGLGKDYSSTAQNITGIIANASSSGRVKEKTLAPETGSGLRRILGNIPETEIVDICFVCTANWNRSPAMEIMGRHLARINGLNNVEMHSFGLATTGLIGRSNDELIAEARRLGVGEEDLQITSKLPTIEDINRTDIFIVASQEHKRALVEVVSKQLGHDIKDRVLVFGELMDEMDTLAQGEVEILLKGTTNIVTLRDYLPDPVQNEISNKSLLQLVSTVFERSLIPLLGNRNAGATTRPSRETAVRPSQSEIGNLWRTREGLGAYWNYLEHDKSSLNRFLDVMTSIYNENFNGLTVGELARTLMFFTQFDRVVSTEQDVDDLLAEVADLKLYIDINVMAKGGYVSSGYSKYISLSHTFNSNLLRNTDAIKRQLVMRVQKQPIPPIPIPVSYSIFQELSSEASNPWRGIRRKEGSLDSALLINQSI